MARRSGGVSAVAPPPSKSERDYMTEDDLRTLERAEEVRGDAERMKRVAAHGRERIRTMSRLVGGTARGKARGKAPSRSRMRGRSGR